MRIETEINFNFINLFSIVKKMGLIYDDGILKKEFLSNRIWGGPFW